MASRYYAGVPGMNEQFGPVVADAAKKMFLKKKQHNTPSPRTLILTLLFSIPVLPIMGAMMMVGESFKLLSTHRFSPEWDQRISNIKYGAVAFMLGCFLYSAILPG